MPKKPLDDNQISAICQAELKNSLGFISGKLAEARLKALQYYNAEPYGNEVEGASQIVTTEVRDTVESMMPSLMKVFMSGDKVAKFDPVSEGDEAVAVERRVTRGDDQLDRPARAAIGPRRRCGAREGHDREQQLVPCHCSLR